LKPDKTSGIGGALSLLTIPAFLRIWTIGGLIGIARWLEMLAIGIYIFDVTQSPLQVTLFTMLRMLPLALFGMFAGTIADRFSHRLVLALGLAGMTATTLVLGALALGGNLALWHIAVGAVLAGIFWSTDYPTRRNMLGVIAGRERIAAAVGLDAAANTATKAIGPAAGGALLALLGMKGVYFLGAALYGLSACLLIGVAVAGTGRAAASFLMSALAITIIFNVWGFPYTAMIAVIGRDDLALGPTDVGLLMSAEGIGGLIATLTIAFLARPWMHRRIYVYGLALCLTMMIAFAAVADPILAGIAVLIAGIGAGCFAAMQSTIILLSAPPEQRGQILGLLVVCIGSGPVGFLHLGLLAHWLGAAEAVMVIAVEGMIALAIAWLIWPETTKEDRR